MKVLITGNTSYIGVNLKKWLGQWPNQYSIDSVSIRNNEWKKADLSQYDALFHVAAIVHTRESPRMESLYTLINRDLTVELAKKAKQAGVKQFIFMSTISVYGLTGEIGRNVVITKDTPCNPTTFYGESKWEAEKELVNLSDENFHIAIVRAPMVYGPNCPGNFTKLKKLIKITPVFPLTNNQRSMIFIDNLSEFIRLLLDYKECGLFFPQNREYVNITEATKLIAMNIPKRIYFSKAFADVLNIVGKRIDALNKGFGNLVIDLQLSSYKDFEYCIADFQKSIVESKD